MKLITIRDLIKEAHAYYSEGPDDMKAKMSQVDPETISVKDFQNVSRYIYMMNLDCDECQTEDLSEVIQLGEEPDFESTATQICLPCLKKAAQLGGII